MKNKKSFNVQKGDKYNTYDEILNYLKGKRIEIIKTVGNHNYGPVGTKITLDNPNMTLSGVSGTIYKCLHRGTSIGNNLNFTCFTVIISETEEEIKEEIKYLQTKKKEIDEEIKLEKGKIAFIKETGSDKYDENEFKAYSALKTIEDKSLSIIERAKLIAKLIND